MDYENESYAREDLDCEWRETTVEEVDAVLMRNRPDSIYIHNLIRGSLKWSRECVETKVALYLPKDSRWEGSVVADVKGPVCAAAIFSPHRSYSFLHSVMKGNNIIDWKSGPMVFCVMPPELFIPFEQSMRSFRVPIEERYIFYSYWLSVEKAKKFEISVPEGAHISRLDLSHASTVNSVWPYASKESLKLVSDMISINPTAGLFIGDDSKPVSWTLQTYYGLGMLHTMEEYRRKGFAATVVKALSKSLGDEGTEVALLVREKNYSANAMFKRLGFNKLGLLGIFQISGER